MLSKHTYASRVVSILATMEKVLLSYSPPSSPSATARESAAADTIVTEERPGGVQAAACVAAPEDAPSTLNAAAGCGQTGRSAITLAASSSPVCVPTSPAAVTANGTSTVANKAADSASRRTCGGPPEAVPNSAGEEQSAADGRASRPTGFPPRPPSRATLMRAAERPRDSRKNVAVRNNDDGSHGDVIGAGGGSVSPDRPPSEVLSTNIMRPNAPMVLVVYRSDFPPPGGWRRSIESAAVTVPGGARVTFMGVGETDPSISTAKYERGQGLKEEETYRRKVLEDSLSRLVFAEGKGENDCPCGQGKGWATRLAILGGLVQQTPQGSALI